MRNAAPTSVHRRARFRVLTAVGYSTEAFAAWNAQPLTSVKVRLHLVTNYKQRYDISACPRSGCSVAVVGITALVDVVGST